MTTSETPMPFDRENCKSFSGAAGKGGSVIADKNKKLTMTTLDNGLKGNAAKLQ